MKSNKPQRHTAYQTLVTLVRLGGLLRKAGDRFFSGYGLTWTQFCVLMALKYELPRGGTQNELCGALLVKPANMTGIVRRMEAIGLVTREVDAEDERVWIVNMTTQGRRTLQQIESAYYRDAERIMGARSETELKRLSLQLEQTQAAVLAQTDQTV